MSSGNFVYTLEQKLARYDQVTAVMKFLQENQRDNERVKIALQAIISNDVNVNVTPKTISTPTGNIYHIVGNYDSAGAAIAAGNYDYKYSLAEDPDKIPLIVQPVDSLVRPVPLGEFVRNDKLFELYPRIVGPMELFTLGAELPELQREGPIFTVWKFGNQFWSAVLDVDVRERCVDVSLADPARGWGLACRVLVHEYVSPEGDNRHLGRGTFALLST